MIKKIHTFGSSYTEGGGFEWWDTKLASPVKPTYKPYIDKWPKVKTQFPMSWPGQLEKLIEDTFNHIKPKEPIYNKVNGEWVANKDNLIVNHARCGWGNERTYRKIFDITNEPNFNPKEHLFLIEFSDECRAQFWSVKYQKHFLVNYDLGEPNKPGLILKQDVEPVFDYHRPDNRDPLNIEYQQYFKEIAPMLTDYIKTTYDRGEVLRRVIQNQITFVSYMELNNLNWLVPLPNAVCWQPQNHKMFRGKFITDKNGEGYQYSIDTLGLGFSKETDGLHTDFHGGLVWSEQVAKETYNLMIDFGFMGKARKVDTSDKTMIKRKLEVRNEIFSRREDIVKQMDYMKSSVGHFNEEYLENKRLL
jgi:hypothetical protein